MFDRKPRFKGGTEMLSFVQCVGDRSHLTVTLHGTVT